MSPVASAPHVSISMSSGRHVTRGKLSRPEREEAIQAIGSGDCGGGFAGGQKRALGPGPMRDQGDNPPHEAVNAPCTLQTSADCKDNTNSAIDGTYFVSDDERHGAWCGAASQSNTDSANSVQSPAPELRTGAWDQDPSSTTRAEYLERGAGQGGRGARPPNQEGLGARAEDPEGSECAQGPEGSEGPRGQECPECLEGPESSEAPGSRPCGHGSSGVSLGDREGAASVPELPCDDPSGHGCWGTICSGRETGLGAASSQESEEDGRADQGTRAPRHAVHSGSPARGQTLNSVPPLSPVSAPVPGLSLAPSPGVPPPSALGRMSQTAPGPAAAPSLCQRQRQKGLLLTGALFSFSDLVQRHSPSLTAHPSRHSPGCHGPLPCPLSQTWPRPATSSSEPLPFRRPPQIPGRDQRGAHGAWPCRPHISTKCGKFSRRTCSLESFPLDSASSPMLVMPESSFASLEDPQEKLATAALFDSLESVNGQGLKRTAEERRCPQSPQPSASLQALGLSPTKCLPIRQCADLLLPPSEALAMDGTPRHSEREFNSRSTPIAHESSSVLNKSQLRHEQSWECSESNGEKDLTEGMRSSIRRTRDHRSSGLLRKSVTFNPRVRVIELEL